MVVMAIIAILATAGLSAYTGYLKKARDTTRIADINAINTIVLGMMSSTGTPPLTAAEVTNAVTAANNGVALADPLGTKVACLTSSTNETATACGYYYRLCDSSTGFSVGAKLESKANQTMYVQDGVGYAATGAGYEQYFELGSCKTYDTGGSGPGAGFVTI